jgi:peptide deformylase
MAVLSVITGENNPTLLKKSKEVSKIDKDVGKLIKDMKDTLIAEEGVGLSAPQVGDNIRVIVVALQKRDKISKDFTLVAMINPRIVSYSNEVWIAEEGCLSLPGDFMNVERAREITVGYLDEKGKEQTLGLENINARIVQHEVDHLDGILITERHKELETYVQASGVL